MGRAKVQTEHELRQTLPSAQVRINRRKSLLNITKFHQTVVAGMNLLHMGEKRSLWGCTFTTVMLMLSPGVE